MQQLELESFWNLGSRNLGNTDNSGQKDYSMLDGNGESCPPRQGHKLGKKKISGNIVGTGGTQPGRGASMGSPK
jgi:hypothetical protein